MLFSKLYIFVITIVTKRLCVWIYVLASKRIFNCDYNN